MKVIRIDKTLVAYIDGKQYAKEVEGTSEELIAVYESLLNSPQADALEFFKAPETKHEQQLRVDFEVKKEKAKEQEDILDFMKDVRDNGHDLFEVKENSVYLKGINISMPELLIREITKAKEDHLTGLINFWSLCAMNSDPRARHDLFEFLKKGSFTITTSGYFVAYRNANVKNQGNQELQKFVTQEWLKVKRWKKSPKNYNVYKSDGDYTISTENHSSNIGNLDDLYQNISNVSETVYTDAHTGTTVIKIGEPVRINRSACDADPNHTCSSGLHVADPNFLNSQGRYFGAESLVCLVNPRHVVAVPYDYNYGKMRVCEYLPIAVAEKDENDLLVEVDTAAFEIEITQHTEEELEMLSKLTSKRLEEYKQHEYIAAEIDFESIRTIKNYVEVSLEEANNLIKNRKI